MVSTATRLRGSWASIASRIESLIWSAILSGWPSVTDSEVKRRRDTRYSLGTAAQDKGSGQRLRTKEPQHGPRVTTLPGDGTTAACRPLEMATPGSGEAAGTR